MVHHPLETSASIAKIKGRPLELEEAEGNDDSCFILSTSLTDICQ
jgi:hypothetical protein